VVVLRHSRPHPPRPYRVCGYLYVPEIFVLGSVWFLANTLREAPREAGCGVLTLAAGLPVYWFWRRRAAPKPPLGAPPS